MADISFQVNGKPATVRRADPAMPLLYALRDDLGLKGPKFGCGMAQCGACTVILDGNAIRSCVTPVSSVAGSNVQTLEGLGARERLHPVQQAFIEAQALQCGYCTNGMVMAAKALLDRVKQPSDEQIVDALEGHLCRCGAHSRIVQAVRRAAEIGASA
jgi:nicotinate dehydrogenase subunit A